MNEPGSAEVAVPRRARRRRVAVVVALLLLVTSAALLVVFFLSDRRMREALAEADRLDPGWRFEDLEKARADVHDAENGALVLRAARAKLPAGWLALPPGGGPGLAERLAELSSSQRPDEDDLKELRSELTKAAAALDVARNLADRPRGRYVVAWTNDLVGTLMPHVQEVREVAHLLCLDAQRLALDGDGAGAIRSCRAALNAGRSLGDEPATISQLVRVACARLSLRALEQTLANTEAPAASLEELQRALAEEAEEPLQLIAARSDRVSYYNCLEVMRSGQFNRASYGVRSSFLGSTADDWIDRGRARACLAAYLRFTNEVVEIAKWPVEEQQEPLKGLRKPSVKLPPLLDGLTRGLEWPKQGAAFHRVKAELRCAAALAAERYRMAEGRWPESLDVLVPRYLDAVPSDPFDGQPLRLRRLPDGLVIYSVGTDGVDDGGNLDRKKPTAPGTDIGFRLWDVARRGKQAPAKE